MLVLIFADWQTDVSFNVPNGAGKYMCDVVSSLDPIEAHWKMNHLTSTTNE
ncbi:hypothetical protein [Metabacillus sp. Hm71]|uniref:hypothetical protein n=1 Tax=Metabacillus sp. Hm71 TaxID=3450743 RepID=UPI003F433DFE